MSATLSLTKKRCIQHPATFRDNVRKELSACLMSTQSQEPISAISDSITKNIEISIYNMSIEMAENKNIIKKWDNLMFCLLYIEKIRSVFWNIGDCPSFREKIVSGEIEPSKIGYMTFQEINPTMWCKFVEEKRKRDLACSTTCVEASTNKFTCSRCKSKKCTYYELQTRSADESLTVFITCLDCDKRWKI